MTRKPKQDSSARKISIGLSIFVLIVVGLLFLTTQTSSTSSGENTAEKTGSSSSREDLADSVSNYATSSSVNGISTTSSVATEQTPELPLGESSERVQKDPFDLELTARAAIVLDRRTGEVLYAKSPDSEEPLASLTKLMTTLVAAQRLRDGPDSTTISAQHLKAYGNEGLRAQENWDLRKLISFMLIESSNDAARAVAAAATEDQADGYAEDFIDEMNRIAKEKGWSVSYFFNPSGLDLNETLVSGGYGSARETAEILAYLLDNYSEIISESTRQTATFYSESGTRYVARNTNSWLPRFSNISASKTGYTVLAGGNLAMGFDLADPVVAVVLGSTRQGRFSDMLKLYNATNAYFANQTQ